MEKLLKEIKELCEYYMEPIDPYINSKSYAFAEGKQDLVEHILGLIKQSEMNENK